MNAYKKVQLIVVLFLVNMGKVIAQTYSVVDYGAKSSLTELSTVAIQKAIDDCTLNGGGTVVFPKGNYTVGTLFLKSNVTLQLEPYANIYGSGNIEDYADVPMGTEEPHFSKCLFYAKGAENITILGHPRSEINGKGYLFKHSHERPKLFRIENSKNISFEEAVIKNSGSWCMYFKEVDGLKIHKSAVYNKENKNNDGIDIDGCSNVSITDTNIQVEDDAICLKSSIDKITENIYVANCTVSSYWASLKFGTASKSGFKNVKVENCQFFDSRHGAVKLLAVDGAVLEDVEISNIKMYNCGGPIFVRLGNRGRDYSESIKQVHDPNAKPEGRPVGKIRNVTFKNIEGRLTGRMDPPTEGIMLTGIPGHPIENITLENIHFSYTGFGAVGTRNNKIAEDEARYPEQLFFGSLPSYGMYVRHVDGLKVKNLTMELRDKDDRPALVLDDVHKSQFSDLQLSQGSSEEPTIMITNSSNVAFDFVNVINAPKVLMEIRGEGSKSISLKMLNKKWGSHPIITTHGASSQSFRLVQ